MAVKIDGNFAIFFRKSFRRAQNGQIWTNIPFRLAGFSFINCITGQQTIEQWRATMTQTLIERNENERYGGTTVYILAFSKAHFFAFRGCIVTINQDSSGLTVSVSCGAELIYFLMLSFCWVMSVDRSRVIDESVFGKKEEIIPLWGPVVNKCFLFL